ncbi:MAG TPA: cytochrome c peroxidase [Rhodothermales bacterium]|nr:cytochrome c peroxidase [Rhodothermales bacterium]
MSTLPKQLRPHRLQCPLLLSTLLLALLATGCDLFADNEMPSTALDDELHDQLQEAADGAGIDFFLLPASEDFSRIPQDPNNPLTADKVALGKVLFQETGLLTDPKRPEGRFTASCASCHHAQAGFQANLPQGIGDGGIGFGQFGEERRNDPAYGTDLDVQPIRSPTTLNSAYQRLMLWNGQFGAVGDNIGTEAQWTEGTPKAVNHLGFHGLESQAIGSLSVHRMATIDSSLVYDNATYRQLFAAAFAGVPEQERITVKHVGLALAAYERTLLANSSPFQRWLRGETGAMTAQEKRGAVLFFGKAGCVGCHTGPALNSETFHALGMDDLAGAGVYGTFSAAIQEATRRGRGGFTQRAADDYKFKTPQLYNLTDSPFYGHGAQFHSLEEVVVYKNRAEASQHDVPEAQLAAEFKPLGLTEQEVADLVAFLKDALYDPDLMRYVPESLPTGQCFPVNDATARQDLGC